MTKIWTIVLHEQLKGRRFTCSEIPLYHWVSGSHYFEGPEGLILEDEGTVVFEMSGTTCTMTQCHILEDLSPQQHLSENLRPHRLKIRTSLSLPKICCTKTSNMMKSTCWNYDDSVSKLITLGYKCLCPFVTGL